MSFRFESAYLIECDGTKQPPPIDAPIDGAAVAWFHFYQPQQPRRCGARFESHSASGSCPECGTPFQIIWPIADPIAEPIEEEPAE